MRIEPGSTQPSRRRGTQSPAGDPAMLFQRALSCSHNGVVISEVCDGHETIIFVNPAFLNMTGYQSAEVIGKSCAFLQGPLTDQEEIAYIRASLAKGEGCETTLLNYRKDGETFWNHLTITPVPDADGVIRHFVGVQSNVSDIHARDEMIRDIICRQEVIFTLTPDGFATFDEGGYLSYANPAFERMTGCMIGDLYGISVAELEHKINALLRPTTNQLDISNWQGQEQKLAVLEMLIPRQRFIKPYVLNGGSASAAIVLHLRDVTHEHEVDRMKSEFLTTAAHELRTPMASIMGFAELLKLQEFPQDMVQDMLDTIHRQSQRLTSLLNELLDLARIEARRGVDFKCVPVSLVNLINNTIQACPREDYPARIILNDLPDIQVFGDWNKLQQAVMNVIVNALKYSPSGGSIHIRSWIEGDICSIEVKDQGIGMSPAHLERVFERFFRADASGNIPGTGLGMCLVKEIIELHRGSVRVSSALGEGTVVCLTLPVCKLSSVPG
ncbi:PAS domain-containing protein [Burkholderiaceae bacterium DAT-1]|nr:PAS domain-containing protein [Burkholderiaceae bacterium DAT-1]